MFFIDYESSEALVQSLAIRVKSELSQAIENNGRATFVVPGGTTPKPFFNLLSDADIEWSKVTVFATDERWVSLESPRSNTGLIKSQLLINRASEAHFIGLFQQNKNLEDGALSLAQIISSYLPIDVLVLGMGADMHTASLFPGASELGRAQRMDAPEVVPIKPLDSSLEPRVTLSARTLETAANTHLLIIGLDKKYAVEKAEHTHFSLAPISQFLPHATVHWSAG